MSINHTSPKQTLMYVDVILTFSKDDDAGSSQEFYELYLPVKKREIDAIRFFDDNLFIKIVALCKDSNRDVKDLIKISTASNWSFFSAKARLPSLPDLGHNCKWYFGSTRDDLDAWEKSLMNRYSFGLNAD